MPLITNKSKTLLASMVFICAIGKSQVTNYANITNVFPASPEVAAFAKYFENPVNLATGVPSISIPVFTVSAGNLSVPISLSYNASGIKVEEQATWVGLGWNLNAGGSLSRVVVGLPDDLQEGGYMYTPYTVKRFLRLDANDPEKKSTYRELLGSNLLDVEPDVFMFSAGNYSGKFYFNQDSKTFIMTPYQNIKLEYGVDGNKNITQFILTTPDGVRYYFGKSIDDSVSAVEKMISTETVAFNGNTLSIAPPMYDAPSHTNNWMLMTILHPTGKQINFKYSVYFSEDFSRGGEYVYYGSAMANCAQASELIQASFHKNVHQKQRLTEINTASSKVRFIPSAQPRKDLNGFNASVNAYLNAIEIRDASDRIVKKASLYFNYSHSQDNSQYLGITPEIISTARHRLILDSVIIMGKDTNARNGECYSFEYESPELLPHRYSTSQDYWGYYNGKQNGDYLMPAVRNAILYTNAGGYKPGADRRTDINFAKLGVLKRIKYPTGGYTDYEYESNVVAQSYLSGWLRGFRQSGQEERMLHFFKGTQYQQANNSGYYAHTFEIKNPTEEVSILSQFTGCNSTFQTIECPVNARLLKLDGNTTVAQYNITNGQMHLNLASGIYRLEANIQEDFSESTPDFNIRLQWEEDDDMHNAIAGGLRIKSIRNNPILGMGTRKTFTYTDAINEKISSGALYNAPIYTYRLKCGNEGTADLPPTLIKVVSAPVAPLASGNGQLIRYGRVTEFMDSSDMHSKTEYVFVTDQFAYVNPETQLYPFPQHVTRDWRNGILYSKRVHGKNIKGEQRILEEEYNTYQTYNTTFSDTFALKIGMYPFNAGFPNFAVIPYSYANEWYLPVQTTKIQRPNDGSAGQITQINSTEYNSWFKPQTTTSLNSKNQTLQSTFRYPFDFPQNPILSAMANRNIIDPVVLQIDSNLTSRSEISRTMVQYEGWHAGKFFMPDSILQSFGGTTPETEGVLMRYDEDGNILESKAKDGLVTSILWGYGKTVPVAKITGAFYNEVLAKSGISLSVINNISLSDNEIFNELKKLYSLKNCIVNIYTYIPHIGIASYTDEAGITTRYRYDGQNRLIMVIDDKGNVVKKYCYNYMGQQESCN